MLKKLLRCFFISCQLLAISYFSFTGCAPKVAPPPLYRDVDLSLEEIITIAQGDIDILKAVVSINIEKDDVQYSNIDASLLLKKPDWLHMRLYKFGILVGDYLVKDNVVHGVSGKGSDKFREFGKELYYSIFWWGDIENAVMYKQATDYVIRTENKEIRLDSSTLLPERQEVTVNGKKIYILYAEPEKEDNLWYPSVVKIEIGAYRFTIKVEKLFINPPLEEDDFKKPRKKI